MVQFVIKKAIQTYTAIFLISSKNWKGEKLKGGASNQWRACLLFRNRCLTNLNAHPYPFTCKYNNISILYNINKKYIYIKFMY
jgi:hypothetical protein